MTNKAMRTKNDPAKLMTENFIAKSTTKDFIGKEDVTTGASKWSLVIKERKGKVGFLSSQQLLWFLASLYLDPGFEPMIS